MFLFVCLVHASCGWCRGSELFASYYVHYSKMSFSLAIAALTFSTFAMGDSGRDVGENVRTWAASAKTVRGDVQHRMRFGHFYLFLHSHILSMHSRLHYTHRRHGKISGTRLIQVLVSLIRPMKSTEASAIPSSGIREKGMGEETLDQRLLTSRPCPMSARTGIL